MGKGLKGDSERRHRILADPWIQRLSKFDGRIRELVEWCWVFQWQIFLRWKGQANTLFKLPSRLS